MPSFNMRPISGTVFSVALGREKIGTVVKSSEGSAFKGDYVGNATYAKRKLTSRHLTASGAFQELVAQMNRIELGVAPDDAAGARVALAEHNRRIDEENAKTREHNRRIDEGTARTPSRMAI